MKFLVICHGNICQSPFAAAVLRHYGGVMFEVRSAGFVNPGQRAAKKMRDAAAARGYDLEEHRSSLVTIEAIRWAHLTVFMDGGNYKRMLTLANGQFSEMTVAPLGNWARPPVKRIPDPAFMGRDSTEFENTVELIEEAARNLAVVQMR